MPQPQPIVYVDMDGVLCDYAKAYNDSRRSNPDLIYPQSKPGFFLELEPLPGAVATVNELRKIFDVFILTAPSVLNPHCYTEKRLWIEDTFDLAFARKLIISPNKELLIGDFLIDDRTDSHGQDKFRGELIHFGSDKWPDWETVLSYLKTRS